MDLDSNYYFTCPDVKTWMVFECWKKGLLWDLWVGTVIIKWYSITLHIVKDVVVVFHEAFHPSILSSIHVWHHCSPCGWDFVVRVEIVTLYSSVFCFFVLAKFCQLATKKNPMRPLGRNFKKELPEHSPYFLERKEKKEKFARFRQWVRVAHLDLGRIAEKTLLST